MSPTGLSARTEDDGMHLHYGKPELVEFDTLIHQIPVIMSTLMMGTCAMRHCIPITEDTTLQRRETPSLGWRGNPTQLEFPTHHGRKAWISRNS